MGSLREVKDMTYAIERLFDSVEEQGIEKGVKKGVKKGMKKGMKKERTTIAKEMLADGETMDKILKYSKLTVEEIEKCRKEIVH